MIGIIHLYWGEKNVVYVMTLVDRHTSCILAWAADTQRTVETIQDLVDSAPQGAFYFSDLLAQYRQGVYYPGPHTPMHDKSGIYRVEGDNAELRHYLARLARRSRCFSRCIEALCCAIKLFVYAWNSPQLRKARCPRYPAHVMQFI